jgi:hypothetical protein
MISGANSIYDFYQFMDALQKAARGVVFLQTIEENNVVSVCTGWLITDELVVAPWNAGLQSAEVPCRFTCRFADAGESAPDIHVQLIPTIASAGSEGRDFSLFRLPQAYPERALRLWVDTLQTGAGVFVLQYTEGAKNLKISAGHVLGVEERTVNYSADTTHGAGGAPVINANGQVMCVHSGSGINTTRVSSTRGEKYNFGIPLEALFMQLKTRSAEWIEIANYHQLAMLGTQEAVPAAELESIASMPPRSIEKNIKSTTSPVLLQAALQWYVNPATLNEGEKEILQPYVIDGHPRKWAMKLEERQRLLSETGSLDELRTTWEKIPKEELSSASNTIRENVIEGILAGPPYKLEAIAEAELPYWLQAVPWFENTITGLPTPSAIHLSLEQRRMRSRLSQVAGPDFSGRQEELTTMQQWYGEKEQGPLLITGIGGVGKSSLISKFILDQPPATVFFWLDFDRADLSPDDAESVLAVIDQQAYVQLEGYKKTIPKEGSWEQQAIWLSKAIAGVLTPSHPALLMVLDGFEVAQHTKKYNEIWQVLELLIQQLPELKVIVSGRAPVKYLQLKGRKAVPLPLKGMDEKASAGWLRAHRITEEPIIAEVFRISKGVPLILRLAARLVEKGGSVFDLPQTLPESMIEGYLYQRILDRVIDPLLHPLAKDLLVVRKVTLPMLEKVFPGSIPGNKEPAEIFEGLMREMGLVNEADPGASIALPAENGELHLRPEVRSATLKLLELENADHVKAIHQKAIDWYLGQDQSINSNRAELIYHYLHLGDITHAEALWQEDCRLLLTDAEPDFVEGAIAARAWLKTKLEAPIPADALINTEAWELDALGRIKDAMLRGLERIVPDILQEQEKRSANSPLLVYDVLVLMKKDQLAEAYQLLEARSPLIRAIQLQRLALKALLARKQGNMLATDDCLLILESILPEKEGDWSLPVLLLRAARIRLQVLLEHEMTLYSLMNEDGNVQGEWIKRNIHRFLMPADVVLPALCEQLNNIAVKQESFTALLDVPYGPSGLMDFKGLLNRKRTRSTGYKYERETPNANLEEAAMHWRNMLEARMQQITKEDPLPESHQQLIMSLALAGLRKWMLATNDLFLAQAADFLMEGMAPNVWAPLALVSAFAALRGEQLEFSRYKIAGTDRFINTVIGQRNKDLLTARLPVTDSTLQKAVDVLQANEPEPYVYYIRQLREGISNIPLEAGQTKKRLPMGAIREMPVDVASVALMILAPDPLEELCRLQLNLPADFEW